MDKAEMVISSSNLPLMGNKKIIVLKEKYGNRLIPIWISPIDAETILAGLKNIQSTKLHAYDFIYSIITGLGATLEHVVICDTKDENLQAITVLKNKKKSIQVECTPSDAISVALRANVPIFVTEDLLVRMCL
jgi:bifunctional DNase/RNase